MGEKHTGTRVYSVLMELWPLPKSVGDDSEIASVQTQIIPKVNCFYKECLI